MNMQVIVLDTSVLIDIFIETEVRHDNGRKIGQFLIEKNFPVKIPFHALFEISARVKNKRINGLQVVFNSNISKDRPLAMDAISIDQKFIDTYLNHDLPYVKGNDLIFLALAKGEEAILITEDTNQYKAAQKAKIEVYTENEFLSKFA